MEIFFVLLQRTFIAGFRSPKLDEFFHGVGQGSLRRAEYGGVTKMTKQYKVGIGWEK